MTTLEETRTSAVNDQRRSRRSSYARKSQKSLEELAAERKLRDKEEKQENLKQILNMICKKELQHADEKDVSLQPSFSKFQLPYIIKCRNRYNASKKLYEQRFQYEIEQLIVQQATGYEAARLNRHLCITTIWPPLHSRSEIAHTQRYFFSLTRKERQRLNWIMSTKII
ncbi:uncharacterized protein LOC119606612 [Lucilia sericata]|uniref:uncharacterized protein LOC119606612 n=1 Tax=Lucilia sericata TaxID=13632 RepID=UPI0018A877FB|nr:uncharacterized protein LOC119606612 [Lucilia sericata]